MGSEMCIRDSKWIRENPEALDAALKKRGAEPLSAKLIELDDKRRAHLTKLQESQERRNSASKEIGKAKASGDEEAAQKAIAEVAEIKAFIQSGEEVERELNEALEVELSAIPNVPLDDVPVGLSEDDNVCLLYTSPSPRDLSTSRMPSSA